MTNLTNQNTMLNVLKVILILMFQRCESISHELKTFQSHGIYMVRDT